MAGPVRRYGRYVSSGEVDYGYIGNGYQRACVYDVSIPSNLIVYGAGAWLGRYQGNPKVRIAIGAVSGGGIGTPGTRLAVTGELTPSAVYVDPTGGQSMFGSVTPFVPGAMSKVAIALGASNGLAAHSMRAAAAITAENRNFYDKSISGNTPTNPIGGSPEYNGHISAWIEGEFNVAPNTPSGHSITNRNTLTPRFESNFSDPNQTLNNGAKWDELTSVEILVKEGGTTRWQFTYNASAAEKQKSKSSRVYAGTALKWFTTYTYQVRHKDRLGLWSPWSSAVSFSLTPTNNPPNTPKSLSPSGSYTSASLTPTLASTFSDPDEVLSTGQAYDYITKFQHRVKRMSDNVWMMGAKEYTATTAERNAKRPSRAYEGSALAYNTNYLFEVRHADRAGAWSPWASAQFSITSTSTVDRPSGPSGFITNRSNPGNITAIYRSSSANANGMQARLLSASGSVLTTSSLKAVSVANGGTLSMTWAESGFGAYVVDGGEYQVQVRARDTNGVYSPSWSPAQTFRMNAAPLVPTGLTPSGNVAVGARPRVTAKASDPDPEHGRPLPKVYLEILSATDSVLQTREMSWVAARNQYEYQTVAADLPSFATYQIRAYSYDGFLYSGGATTAAAAQRSAVSVFQYAAVPNVTVTGPPSPVDSTTVPIMWDVDKAQARYRVQLYQPGTSVEVYDSGIVTDTRKMHGVALSGANWKSGQRWYNGQEYDAVVSVAGSDNLFGQSEPYTILLQFPAPTTLELLVERVTLPNTSQDSALLGSWDMTGYDASDFERYEYWRVELNDDGTVRHGTELHLLTIRDPAETIVLDAEVTSGQRYRYWVVQFVNVGNDVLESDPGAAEADVSWTGLMLHAPYDPENTAVELAWSAANQEYKPSLSVTQPRRFTNPTGRVGRSVFFGSGRSLDPSGDFGLIDDHVMSANERLDRILFLLDVQSGDYDEEPHAICWREGRGGAGGRVYGALDEPQFPYAPNDEYDVRLSLVETRFTLGEG